jgi:hypothetical protein
LLEDAHSAGVGVATCADASSLNCLGDEWSGTAGRGLVEPDMPTERPATNRRSVEAEPAGADLTGARSTAFSIRGTVLRAVDLKSSLAHCRSHEWLSDKPRPLYEFDKSHFC